MSYYVGVPLIVLIALIEASVLPLFRVASLQPNLTLVFLVTWMMVRGQKEALVLIPIAGISLGLVDGAPIGAALLAIAPIAVLYDLRDVHLGEGQFSTTLLFTFIATFAYQLVFLLTYVIFGDSGSWIEAFMQIVAPTAILNLACAVPIYFAVWVMSGDTRRATFA